MYACIWGIMQCDHAEEACKVVQGRTVVRIERLDGQHTSDATSSPERRTHSSSGVVPNESNHTCNIVHPNARRTAARD